jgi:hypothetical protein
LAACRDARCAAIDYARSSRCADGTVPFCEPQPENGVSGIDPAIFRLPDSGEGRPGINESKAGRVGP